jgi:hypothetical protein
VLAPEQLAHVRVCSWRLQGRPNVRRQRRDDHAHRIDLFARKRPLGALRHVEPGDQILNCE